MSITIEITMDIGLKDDRNERTYEPKEVDEALKRACLDGNVTDTRGVYKGSREPSVKFESTWFINDHDELEQHCRRLNAFLDQVFAAPTPGKTPGAQGLAMNQDCVAGLPA